MKRSTWRGSPALAAARRKYWLNVAGNIAAMLAFSAGIIACLFIALDHLAS